MKRAADSRPTITMVITRQSPDTPLSPDDLRTTVAEYFEKKDYEARKILCIVPDNTRSGPVGELFKLIHGQISAQAKAVDVLIALGTHPPLDEGAIRKRLSLSDEERKGEYAGVKFFNHEWDKPGALTSIGKITEQEISEISGGLMAREVDVLVNKLIFDYDELLIIGSVFPHEVAGISGGHKYIFPGVSGAEITYLFHWLGALITNMEVIGNAWTPTRRVIEHAAQMLKVPRTLVAVASRGEDTHGVFIGDPVKAWEEAAALSRQLNITYKDKPFHTVLSMAAEIYDDIWTAGKAMFKLEPVVADGGKLIVYAPHVKEISYTHGKTLDEIGYHVRDYFVKQMDKFKHVPGGIMAHSTHLKGTGTYEDGVEKPRIEVILATGISKERCEKVNLGYMDPNSIDVSEYEGREAEGVLVVKHAGEILYRLKP